MSNVAARGRPYKRKASSDNRTRMLVRLAAQLAGIEIAPTDAEVLVRAYWDLVFRQVVARGRHLVPDFGVFYLKRLKARQVRNPAGAGELMQLPPAWRLAFRASKNRKGLGEPR